MVVGLARRDAENKPPPARLFRRPAQAAPFPQPQHFTNTGVWDGYKLLGIFFCLYAPARPRYTANSSTIETAPTGTATNHSGNVSAHRVGRRRAGARGT
jgi:hypothetical protein